MVTAMQQDEEMKNKTFAEKLKNILENDNASNSLKIMHLKGELKENAPDLDRLFEVPEKTDFHPEGNSGAHTLLALNEVHDPMARYAMLVHDLGKLVTFEEQIAKNPDGDRSQMVKHFGHAEKGLPLVEKLSTELAVPAEWKEFAEIICKNHMKAHDLDKMKDSKLFEFIQEVPEKYWQSFMQCCLADGLGRDIPQDQKDKIREEFKQKQAKAEEVRTYMKAHPNEDKNTFANNFAKYKKQQIQNKGPQQER